MHPEPVRHVAQLVCWEQDEPPLGPAHSTWEAAQSLAGHCPEAGPPADPARQEFEDLHHPQPGLATHEPQSGDMVAHSTCGAWGMAIAAQSASLLHAMGGPPEHIPLTHLGGAPADAFWFCCPAAAPAAAPGCTGGVVFC